MRQTLYENSIILPFQKEEYRNGGGVAFCQIPTTFDFEAHPLDPVPVTQRSAANRGISVQV
jgi:hypothetical protein